MTQTATADYTENAAHDAAPASAWPSMAVTAAMPATAFTTQTATAGYTRTARRHHELSIEQLNAIDLLVTGATDRHVADTVGVHRVTVTRWRLYHPDFRVELNRRRREAYGGAADALRTVLPIALDTLRDQLRVGPSRGQMALSLLHKAGLTAPSLLSATAFPPSTDEGDILAEILDAEVRRRRAACIAENSDDEQRVPVDAPICRAEREAALDYLYAMASQPDQPDPDDLPT